MTLGGGIDWLLYPVSCMVSRKFICLVTGKTIEARDKIEDGLNPVLLQRA